MIRIRSSKNGPYITLEDLCDFLLPLIEPDLRMSKIDLIRYIERDLEEDEDIETPDGYVVVNSVIEALRYALRSVACDVCKGDGDCFNDEIFCDKCDGTGKEEDTCGECEGDGDFEKKVGSRIRYVKCENCNGEGQIQLTCNECDGKGYYRGHEICIRCEGSGDLDMEHLCYNIEKKMERINLSYNILVKVY